MKVCVFGAGAIGVYLAGHLAKAGLCDASLIARGANLAAIRARGLRVKTPAGEIASPIHAVSHAEELGPQDYVFLTLKAQQLDAALPQIAPLIGRRTCVIPPTTGLPYCFFHGAPGPLSGRRLAEVDSGGRQWNALPPAQALGCVYWIGAHLDEFGLAVQDGARAGAPVGEMDGSTTQRVTALSQLLEASGIRAPLRPDIRAEIWVKFVNSLCWNPIAVLTKARMGEMAQAEGVIDLVTQMMREADAMGDAIGLTIPTPPEKRIATTLSAPMHKMSMLQDLEGGRALELAPLQCSLAAVAGITGLATPTLTTILNLASLRASVAMRDATMEPA